MSALKRVVPVTRTIDLLCSPMCKCKDLCKNKPPRTDAYDLSMTNYQVMMKNSENIHVPWCVYHYFMIVLFTITKLILNAVQLDFSFIVREF